MRHNSIDPRAVVSVIGEMLDPGRLNHIKSVVASRRFNICTVVEVS